MEKNTILRVLSLAFAVLMLMTMVIGCNKEDNNDDNKDKGNTTTGLTGCTVTVKTEGGAALENIGVSVYDDKDKSELVDFVRTDANGVAQLTASIPSGSMIFLTDVSEDYVVEECYPLTEKDTVITLAAAVKTELSPITLGGVMFDFTVTDQNGTEHTMSELLKSKKAVVLNLWYTTCVPCQMEFPFLQQAYNEYSEDIALLALSPMDNADAIAAFATEKGLTIPMAPCDPAWDGLIEGISYPTTVIIDRFGTVALIHMGAIDSSKTFKNAFAHFTAEDYVQQTFTDMSQFVAADTDDIGTAENPYEYSGTTGFSVEVEAGKTVHYNLYGADGLSLSLDAESVKLVCNDKEYTPNKGSISFTINTEDPSAAVKLQFTNTGKEKATYKVTFTAPEGAAGNPIMLKDGDITIKLEANNSRGMYYLYRATNEGTVTVTCKNTVNYTVTLLNKVSNKTTKLDKDTKTASIDVRKFDEIQIAVLATPKSGKYPATEAKLNISFKKYEEPTTPPTTAPTTGGSTTTGGTGGGSTGTTTAPPTQPPAINTNGTLVNGDAPVEIGGSLDYEIPVKSGEILLYHFYRMGGTTLRIVNPYAYLIYDGKTIVPDQNGVISLPVEITEMSVPMVVQIGNGGPTDDIIKVRFSYPEGHMQNPFSAELGSLTVNVNEGNDQGVYYLFFADQAGTLNVTLNSISGASGCEIIVYNLNSYEMRQLSDSDSDTVSVKVKAGQKIRISFATEPDEDFNYPAATVETVLSFS